MPNHRSSGYAHYTNLINSIAGYEVPFITKPGIEQWDQVTPAEKLIAELVHFTSNSRVAIYGCRHGALPAVLALMHPSISFTCIESNWISFECINQTINNLRLLNLNNRQYPIDPHLPEGSIQTAIMLIPKGRNLARRWLLEIYPILEPGGVLYLGGAKNAGIQSIIDDACDLFANSEVLGYKKGERIAQVNEKKEKAIFSDWTRIDGIIPQTWYEFNLKIADCDYKIRSLPGVFSAEKLDEGTRLLMENLAIPEKANVLDIGCGFGILGLSAARKQATAYVEMVDTDLMAVASSNENIRLNSLPNAHAFASDLLSECGQKAYQLIISNPPFHSGRDTNYIISEAMIEQAYQRLSPGGEFILVANRFLPYERQLKEYFSKVFVKSKTNKFQVISGVR